MTTNQWIRSTFDSQTQIGWQHSFSGLLCTQWIDRQNQSRPNQPNGSTLIAAIIKTIFNAILLRWDDRNHHLHQNKQNVPEIRCRAIAKVRALYECQPHILYSDNQIFAIPLGELLLKPTRTLQLFVSQNQHIIKQSIRKQQQLTRRLHHDIRSYFTTLHMPTRVAPGK